MKYLVLNEKAAFSYTNLQTDAYKFMSIEQAREVGG